MKPAALYSNSRLAPFRPGSKGSSSCSAALRVGWPLDGRRRSAGETCSAFAISSKSVIRISVFKLRQLEYVFLSRTTSFQRSLYARPCSANTSEMRCHMSSFKPARLMIGILAPKVDFPIFLGKSYYNRNQENRSQGNRHCMIQSDTSECLKRRFQLLR